MRPELIASLTIFALAAFLGLELISRVPTLLHTPLMSGTNAIHGIVLVGAMLIAGSADSTHTAIPRSTPLNGQCSSVRRAISTAASRVSATHTYVS